MSIVVSSDEHGPSDNRRNIEDTESDMIYVFWGRKWDLADFGRYYAQERWKREKKYGLFGKIINYICG